MYEDKVPQHRMQSAEHVSWFVDDTFMVQLFTIIERYTSFNAFHISETVSVTTYPLYD